MVFVTTPSLHIYNILNAVLLATLNPTFDIFHKRPSASDFGCIIYILKYICIYLTLCFYICIYMNLNTTHNEFIRYEWRDHVTFYCRSSKRFS
jgi:hypothetical protein